jgi:hypothetical protein
MKKAFNSIQRLIVLDILISINIAHALLKAVVDINTQNKILIKYNSKLSRLVEINKGVCQGCSLLPTLFNIYLDETIIKWQKEEFHFQVSAAVDAVIC